MREIYRQLRNSFYLLRGNRRFLFGLLFVALLIKVMTALVVPRAIMVIFDSIQNGQVSGSLQNINFSLISIAVLMILIAWINIYGDSWATKLGFSKVKNSFETIYSKFVTDIINYYNVGEIYQRIQSGCHTSISIWFSLVDLSSSVLSLLIIFFMVGSVNYYILLIYMMIPFVIIFYTLVSFRIKKKINQDLQLVESDMMQDLYEIITYSDMIKNFGAADWASERYYRSRERSFSLQKKKVLIDTTLEAVQDLIDFLLRAIFGAIIRFTSITWGIVGITFVLYDNVKQKSSEFYSSVTALPGSIIPLKRLAEVFDNHHARPIKFSSQIILSGVSKSYQDHIALNNVNLTVQPGDKIALIGGNGSGKSTLLKIIGLQLGCSHGELSFPYTNHKERQGAVSAAFSAHQLYPVSVLENVGMSGESASKEDIQDQLVQFYISQHSQKDAGMLSQGEAQRVNLARALIKKAPILILDEPTSSLDPNTAKKVMKHILENSQTVLYATHDPEIAKMAHYIIQVDKGTISRIYQQNEFASSNIQ